MRPITPIILAKPKQSHAEAAKPLVKPLAPVSHGDVVATVLDAVGAKPSKLGWKSLFAYDGREDPYQARYYLTNLQVLETHRDQRAVEWCIRGDSHDFDNWSKTGKAFDLGDKQYIWIDEAEDAEAAKAERAKATT